MRVLSLDMAFKNIGYVVYEDHKIIDYGVIKPPQVDHDLKSFQDANGCLHISKELRHLIESHRIDKAVMELSSGGQSQRACKLLGFSVGIAIGVTSALRVPLDLITPNDVKMLLGKNNATKKEMIAWASLFLPKIKEMSLCTAEHIADAIAVYEFWKKGELRSWR